MSHLRIPLKMVFLFCLAGMLCNFCHMLGYLGILAVKEGSSLIVDLV